MGGADTQTQKEKKNTHLGDAFSRRRCHAVGNVVNDEIKVRLHERLDCVGSSDSCPFCATSQACTTPVITAISIDTVTTRRRRRRLQASRSQLPANKTGKNVGDSRRLPKCPYQWFSRQHDRCRDLRIESVPSGRQPSAWRAAVRKGCVRKEEEEESGRHTFTKSTLFPIGSSSISLPSASAVHVSLFRSMAARKPADIPFAWNKAMQTRTRTTANRGRNYTDDGRHQLDNIKGLDRIRMKESPFPIYHRSFLDGSGTVSCGNPRTYSTLTPVSPPASVNKTKHRAKFYSFPSTKSIHSKTSRSDLIGPPQKLLIQ